MNHDGKFFSNFKSSHKDLAKNSKVRFYDVYILVTTKQFSREIFIEALAATSEHRGSTEIISDKKSLLERIANSSELQEMWIKYQKKFAYAQTIEYASIIVILGDLLGVVID